MEFFEGFIWFRKLINKTQKENMERNKDFVFSNELNAIRGNEFNAMYPKITEHILTRGVQHESRYGKTRRVKDFKTEILNPMYRVVGGYGRNANIYFLVAEAMWIWLGNNDVQTLALYNNKMRDFSDDGVVFHAAYGHRLRKHFGIDQIELAVEMLSSNPDTRRCVLQIWDSVSDLNAKSKDIPCNDLLMFDIDKGLNITVENRSNDLHWGLTTNVFQFSFILEMLANVLDVNVGKQTHNSKDLHIYMDNNTTEMMARGEEPYNNIYHDFSASAFDIEALDGITNPRMRLKMVDKLVGQALNAPDSNNVLMESSTTLAFFNQLLTIFKNMRSKVADKRENMNVTDGHVWALEQLDNLDETHPDILAMARNFHARRLADKGYPGYGGEFLGGKIGTY